MSNTIGATTMEQLKANLATIDLKLNEEVLSAIKVISLEILNLAP
ncbi:MAG: hypothetical protein OQK24_11150 [Magnetovibrio sp.]|nr:hypothetical protein [Magnetovibrio sp.]